MSNGIRFRHVTLVLQTQAEPTNLWKRKRKRKSYYNKMLRPENVWSNSRRIAAQDVWANVIMFVLFSACLDNKSWYWHRLVTSHCLLRYHLKRQSRLHVQSVCARHGPIGTLGTSLIVTRFSNPRRNKQHLAIIFWVPGFSHKSAVSWSQQAARVLRNKKISVRSRCK